ncbi:uncharacterized protein LOC126993933 isoform X4 [Eriocheir sinensis]|uniref:uncharacterized protein LOC126993933 isoform X4 n=1 Tax=Eriocheir sinensis TaxID=95602 RepID=UPI0021C9D5F2|nr:uncharacterized protein LOC126993933 isoform X4 [Eriocheir sinensis]
MRRKNAGVKVGEDRGVPIRRPDSPTGHLYSKSKSKNSCLLLTPAGADSCWCWCRRHSQHSTQQLPSSGDPKTPCPGRGCCCSTPSVAEKTAEGRAPSSPALRDACPLNTNSNFKTFSKGHPRLPGSVLLTPRATAPPDGPNTDLSTTGPPAVSAVLPG